MPYLNPIPTKFSPTLAETRKRVISLYRHWQKSVPTIVIEYRVNYPQAVLRTRIRSEFEKKRHLTDIGAINIALFRGRAELEETLNNWKQTSHLADIIEKKEPEDKQMKFLDSFLAGQN
ncbi:NADH-ubiquinone oxidoreductase [Zancudomyces culisetae]|uniref:NADH-ubiquinone oxidoreductase n=1 Tax=Zancudomyces culisetae TaxID=1213189 RepID=A0A1R1PX13_ZANCU|nr:NADH-ubiquinone oxidoreductase [Zancudomyces culisetae]|eukprot:OMH85463.1 NADH-ubiquinone oxidoreductase [Zancudomyces culisetae]